MVEERLKRRLYEKIHTEYLSYQKSVCNLASEDVYEKAYEISIIKEIYKNLLEAVPKMDTEQKRRMLSEQSLLVGIYQEWLKVEDSMGEELTVLAEKLLTEWNQVTGGRMAG